MLADEVNRAPAKTQAALLEAMQERQVTADGTTHPLDPPFLVIATQNPIEYEGTYPLPEAQLDRFILRTTVGYPSHDDEWDLLARRMERGTDEVVLSAITDPAGLRAMQASLETVHVDEAIGRYVVALVDATRQRLSAAGGSEPSRQPRSGEAESRPRRARRPRLRDAGRREGDRHPRARASRGAAQRPVGAAGVGGRGARRARRRGAGTVGSVSAPVALQRQSTARLVAVAAVAVAGLFAGILTGRVELVALGAPFAVLLVGGVVMAERPRLGVDVVPDSDRVVAGEDIVVRDHDLELRAVVAARGLAPPSRASPRSSSRSDGRLVWATRVGRRPTSLVVRAAESPVGGRVARPAAFGGGRAVRVGALDGCAARPRTTVRVLPDDGTLRALLPNVEPRAASGAHVARRRGEGFEFAEVRQYREGDRLRSVNWYQTARRGELWVNDHHPEKSGDLVVLVDTFADRPSGGSASLERSVRVAWQVAMAHLAAHDRVGVVGFGGLPSWVTPGGGERARLAVHRPAARVARVVDRRRSARSPTCLGRSFLRAHRCSRCPGCTISA